MPATATKETYMTCRRCGEGTPRLTREQIHCPKCDREVRDLVRIDAERMARRTWAAKELHP